jgi:hypothetical protein
MPERVVADGLVDPGGLWRDGAPFTTHPRARSAGRRACPCGPRAARNSGAFLVAADPGRRDVGVESDDSEPVRKGPPVPLPKVQAELVAPSQTDRTTIRPRVQLGIL